MAIKIKTGTMPSAKTGGGRRKSEGRIAAENLTRPGQWFVLEEKATHSRSVLIGMWRRAGVPVRTFTDDKGRRIVAFDERFSDRNTRNGKARK